MTDIPVAGSRFYEHYSHFARTLRGWLVAYGIGLPILIASQESLTQKLIYTGKAKEYSHFLSGWSPCTDTDSVLVQICTMDASSWRDKSRVKANTKVQEFFMVLPKIMANCRFRSFYYYSIYMAYICRSFRIVALNTQPISKI